MTLCSFAAKVLAPMAMLLACGQQVVIESQGEGGGGASSQPPLSGSYVLAIASPDWASGRPFLFDTQLVNDGELRLSLQPLTADSRGTAVGPSDSAGPFEVVPPGVYTLDVDDLVVPSEAQPDADKRRSRVWFVLVANEPLCGELVEAELRYDADNFSYYWLTGSFALQLASVADAYTNPIIDCEGNHAEPLP